MEGNRREKIKSQRWWRYSIRISNAWVTNEIKMCNIRVTGYSISGAWWSGSPDVTRYWRSQASYIFNRPRSFRLQKINPQCWKSLKKDTSYDCMKVHPNHSYTTLRYWCCHCARESINFQCVNISIIMCSILTVYDPTDQQQHMLSRPKLYRWSIRRRKEW